jgi:lipopolysaccharide heptosyltransferase II
MAVMFLKKVDKLIGPLLTRLWSRPPQSRLLKAHVSRLLLIRPGGIGDAVLLVPAIKLLRDVFPVARIEVLAEKRNCGVFNLCPGIDHIFCYDSPLELLAVLKSNYDVVIDTEQWHRLSALVARMIRSRVKIGYATNARQRMFTHPVDYIHDIYELRNFFKLLNPLGIEAPATVVPPFLTIHKEVQRVADSMLGNFVQTPFITLFPGTSTVEKCWGVEKFRQLARRLIDEGHAVVVVGGKEDAITGSTIVHGTSCLNLVGMTSLCVTAGVLNRSQLLVGGDSGVLHIGAGLGTPTVSLFGPSSTDKWAPSGKQHVVINHKLPCSPCTSFGTTPHCQIGSKCIQGISVDEVFAAIQEILDLNYK